MPEISCLPLLNYFAIRRLAEDTCAPLYNSICKNLALNQWLPFGVNSLRLSIIANGSPAFPVSISILPIQFFVVQ